MKSFARYAGVLCAVIVVVNQLGGCASDGGVGGTGISSTVQGNVTKLALWSRAAGGDNTLSGVEVVVMENLQLADTTDDDGYFAIEGVFPEVATLEFRRDGFAPATTTIFVPARSTVNMDDVALIGNEVNPGGIRLDYAGTLVDVEECDLASGRIAVRDESNTLFEITFGENVLEFPLACDNICVGDELGIRAYQIDDGIEAYQIKRTDNGPRCGP